MDFGKLGDDQSRNKSRMKVEAIVTFAGRIGMIKGEIREVDASLAAPLLKCGYLEEVKAVQTKESKRNNGSRNLQSHKRSSGKSE